MTTIKTPHDLKSAIEYCIDFAKNKLIMAPTMREQCKAKGEIAGYEKALTYINALILNQATVSPEPTPEEPMILNDFRPTFWFEVWKFVQDNRLDQGVYFTFAPGLDVHDPIWTRYTRQIAIWCSPGAESGYYVHVDEITGATDHNKIAINKAFNMALGKYATYEEALRATELLTRFINGWPIKAKEPEKWSEVWKGG